jgi:hypothetical protein
MKLRSDSLSEFAPAFIKAQSEFTNVGKNRDGRFKYADLDAIMKMAMPILSKHGFFVSHATQFDKESGKTLLHTTITHSSDQWIKSIAPIELSSDARELQQEFGKAKSYQERYALKSILGVTIADDPMDNDGGHQKSYQTSTYSDDKITDKQVALLKGKTLGRPEIRQAIFSKFNIRSFEELKRKDVSTILEIIEKA